MSDVRRVGVEAQDDGVYEVWVDPNGTDALMPWEDYERLRKVVEKADRIIKNETPSGIYHNWQTALRELEESDE